ncbi:hypothetical protein V9T40_008728 [Parthenolecanium corni]|uniref:Uncharacterized protein n=1 Tax=Parthenolecanium corni TaxID=536013 RepID=A0AAN9TP54_9HEMI
MEMTNVTNTPDTYNFNHHAYEPYSAPLSIIESERSRICPSDVPIDLFIVHQPSPQFQSQIERFNIAKREINQMDSSTDEKTENNETKTDKNLESFSDSTVQSTRHLQCPDSPKEEKFITDDRFIAPSLRENKTASSS